MAVAVFSFAEACFGLRWPIVICCAGAAVTAYLLQGVNVAQDTNLFIAGIGLHGLFVNAVQCSLYALCAYVYPTLVRATGTASALAFGRLGAILSSFAGAAVITAGGAHAYLTLLGSAMVVTLVAMMIMRKHIPRVGAVANVPAPFGPPLMSNVLEPLRYSTMVRASAATVSAKAKGPIP